MKKYVILMSLMVLLFNACKEEQKCCCTNFSIGVNVQLIDSSRNGAIDTNFLKNNNELNHIQCTDSIVTLDFWANIDSTEDDKKIITTNLLRISATDTDTILTEIYGICGRSITKIWYNGVLKNRDEAIVITK